MSSTVDAVLRSGKSHREKLLVVGIGASAGGITAIKQFFQHVSPTRSIAYVVILHLSPNHDSKLAEVLQVTVPFPVTQVNATMLIEADHVYVVPPNKSLRIVDGSLRVSEITRIEERRAPVDVFFRTLAESYGSRAVSVILSGTGSNGSAGLKLIKENGGLAVAQNPDQAEYGDMPAHAIATGLVDLVLPIEAMPGRITAYDARLRDVDLVLSADDVEDPGALREILTLLKVRTGHDFSNYKTATLLRRIQRRMTVGNVVTLPDYARLIRERPDEAITLMRDLLISVTHFFRDASVFAALEQGVIPRLFDRKTPNDSVRVWVPACATGEEAYSLAILLAEYRESRIEQPSVQIFATDLDEHAIATAREGFYKETEIAEISDARLARYFQREAAGYRVQRELRKLILFAPHDIVKDPAFSHQDLISCRNFLIYLNRPAQDRVLETFHFALRPGGFLLLGPSESTDGSDELFTTVDRALHFYQSRPVSSRLQLSQSPRATAPAQTVLPAPRPLERLAPLDAHHRLLEAYAPPSLIVTEDHAIVHISARAGRFLQLPAGEPPRDVIRLVRPELRADLRTALYQSAKLRTSTTVTNVPIAIDGAERRIDLIVRPALREDDPVRGFFLVIFADHEGGDDLKRDAHPLDATSEPMALQLEEELARLRAQLRTTVEQYEVQVEEAKAAAEEQQATNEELRSAAEELETSKEELQSVNEELKTVNQELQVKIEELHLSNSDFENLINSTDIATIFLDRDLRLKLATPRARDVFNLLRSDRGRPLSDITSRLRYDGLNADMHRVLDTLQPVDREVQATDGRWYLMRIRPYRTHDDRIDGVVLVFPDITDRLAAERTLSRGEERLRLLIDNATDYAIFTMTEEGQIDSWNPGAERMFGYTSDAIVGRHFEILFTQEDRAKNVPQQELEQARRDGRAADERYHARRDGSVFYGSGVTNRLGTGGNLGFAKIARDLTAQAQAAEALADAHSALEVKVAERTSQLAAEVKAHKVAQSQVVKLLRTVVTAQEDERSRIARNLHDQLGQRLTALRLSLERLESNDAKAATNKAVDESLAMVQAIDAEVGFLAWELRPAVLDHLGLAVALPRYIQEWSEHYRVETEYSGMLSEKLPGEVEIALYRIVQEALTNVAKHAHATRADVLLETRGETVVLVVEDDGVGFEIEQADSNERGIGVMGMRERAELIGAEFQLESRSGGGTSVYVRYTPGATLRDADSELV